jgi:hypothetical protein
MPLGGGPRSAGAAGRGGAAGSDRPSAASPEGGNEEQQRCAHGQGSERHDQRLRRGWFLRLVCHHPRTFNRETFKPKTLDPRNVKPALRAKGGRLSMVSGNNRDGYARSLQFSQILPAFRGCENGSARA